MTLSSPELSNKAYKYLITGSSGYLGNILYENLKKDGPVIGVSRTNSDITVDLLTDVFKFDGDVDTVIHTAAFAHNQFKNKNIQNKVYDSGPVLTRNLLSSLENSNFKNLIYISSVAVYGEHSKTNIDENNKLNGSSAYAKSKIDTESLLSEYAASNNVNLLILRLPLIVGENAPGNLRKLKNMAKRGFYLSINNGKAKRSVIYANDLAKIIKMNLNANGVFNITDGKDVSFRDFEVAFKSRYHLKVINISRSIFKPICQVGELLGLSSLNMHLFHTLSSDLTFTSRKAFEQLEYHPTIVRDVLAEIVRDNINN